MAEVKDKIHILEDLSAKLQAYKNQGKTIVHCHGVFDLLHIGHIRHFQEAKSFGDILVVTITADEFVNKGPHRPAFTQALRAEALAALESVDLVSINYAASAVPAIKAIKPNFYVKGPDYANRTLDTPGKLVIEIQEVELHGGSLVFTNDIQFSSTNLLNKFFPHSSSGIHTYLEQIRAKYSLSDITSLFERANNLSVLIIGETIIDEYHYVEAIGKAGKEPVLVTRSLSSEQFAGGVLAIANHVAGFCKNVGMLSCLGEINSQEEFIRGKLKENINATFLAQKGKPTITKLRYVDNYLLQKLFEVYFIDDSEQNNAEEIELLETLENILPQYDVVIVADYGHGMLSKAAIELLCAKAKFLCVNTQANAGNRGLHTISRYPRADYVSLSEGELRLEMRNREEDSISLLHNLMGRISCPTVTLTKGRHGIMCLNQDNGLAEGPGFTQSVVDRVGSGDAVLAVTSPLAAVGAHPEILALIGNIAGSEAVKTVGHRSSLDYALLKRHLTAILK
jgi:rfaE bifunctional protein kinase chain/domain/rfaE bifunctional protein nucleotidyltransferase chain/domain